MIRFAPEALGFLVLLAAPRGQDPSGAAAPDLQALIEAIDTDRGLAAAAALVRLRAEPDRWNDAHTLARALADRRPNLDASLPSAVDLTRVAIDLATVHQRPDLALAAALGTSLVYARNEDFAIARQLAELGLAAVRDGDRNHLLLHLASVEMAAGDLHRTEELLGEVERHLAATTPELRARYQTALREQQGRLALEFGLLDRAAACFAEVARAYGRDHPRMRLWSLELALAAEDFTGALAIAEELAQLPQPPLPAAALQLRAAIARHRLADDDAAAREAVRSRLSEALTRSARPAARARLQTRLAALLVEAGDLSAARQQVASARSHLDEVVGIDLLRERSALDVVDARIVLAAPETTASELTATRDRLLAAHGALLERWRNHPARPGGYGYLQLVARRDLIATLVGCELRLHPERPEQGLVHVLATQELGSTALRFDLRAPTPTELRQKLAPRSGGLLIYLPSHAGSHLFVVTPEDCRHLSLPPLGPIRDAVRQLKALLQRGASARSDPGRNAQLVGLGERIRRAILPPSLWAELRGWRELAVIGRDLLADLPFEALPGLVASWLGQDLAISYLPSAPVGAALAQLSGRRTADRDVLLVAATEPGAADLPKLPVDASDLASWLEPFVDTELMLGAAATRDAFLRRPLQEFGVVCVLAHGTHGGARVEDPRSSVLMLARAADGSQPELRCSDVEALTGLPDVVLLAACGTARGAARRGDDQGTHFAGAFLNAGCQAVVAASTDLELETAERLFPMLLRELAAGHSIATALQRARVSLAADPRFEDPSCHATVHVFGLGGALPRLHAQQRAERTHARTPVLAWLLPLLAVVAFAAVVAATRARRGVTRSPG